MNVMIPQRHTPPHPSSWREGEDQNIFRLIAHEAVPVLVVLYPLLLLLDDIEPGFVRSVVNPHAFLIALIAAAMLAPAASSSASPSRRAVFVGGVVTAGIVGGWMWWRLGGSAFAAFPALLVAIAIWATAWAITDPTRSS